MFVVEPGPGQTKQYPSARDLGAAIRRGELGPQARIYHRATDRWLPITVHPEYRRIAAEWEELGARELHTRHWTFLPSRRAEAAPAPEPPAEARPGSAPVLIPGDPEPSWLGSTIRRLKSIAHL